MHGGSSTGAPKANKNALRHGRYTAESIAFRREIAMLAREARKTEVAIFWRRITGERGFQVTTIGTNVPERSGFEWRNLEAGTLLVYEPRPSDPRSASKIKIARQKHMWRPSADGLSDCQRVDCASLIS
jgi:hypothetical protein